MQIIIGDTGLVGQNLKDQINFDLLFNSKNINTFDKLVFDNSDLFLSCLPGTKWKVNQTKESILNDLNNLLNLINIIKNKQYNNIVLISSIDVYLQTELESNEDDKILLPDSGYARNRYLFEILVESLLKYNNLKIIRLPALFGNYLKKNALFDLINNNLDYVNEESFFQWYNLSNISKDIEKSFKNSEKIINLFSEPVQMKDIIDLYFKNIKINKYNNFQNYNYKTKITKTGYIKNKEEILFEIGKYINDNRKIK
jgi:nucleoside-diphosphate-sugar epimerase